MNWQPMATAPKDGREVLAYDCVVDKFDVVHFRSGYFRPTQQDGEWGPSSDDFAYDMKNVTLWCEIERPQRPTPFGYREHFDPSQGGPGYGAPSYEGVEFGGTHNTSLKDMAPVLFGTDIPDPEAK